MAAEYNAKRNSNAQLLEELEALSQSLYQSHTSTTPAPTRRTASLALPRTSVPSIPSADDDADTSLTAGTPINKPRTRRLSLSPWRSKPKLEETKAAAPATTRPESKKLDERSTSAEKKGIWSWKPMRALSHIGMQKLSCLFSVEVVAAQGLPSSMNGLRLSVCVRKKETKDGAVQTMPSRVAQGAADFEETLFIRCHVYCTHGSGKQKLKFEPRPFWIYLFAVDAKELDFGRSSADLSHLIAESIEKNQQGTRIRQWDTSFSLSGKAKGGELVVKLGFQIMEKDGGIEIYNQDENTKSSKLKNLSSSFARKQSKTSFSMPSPRITSKSDIWTPSQSQVGEEVDIQGMDDLNLDDPNPIQDTSTSARKFDDQKAKVEDFDLPDFEVVDKGVEVQEKEEDGAESEKSMDMKSASSEVVKEIVHDQLYLNLARLTELDSIAQQIKALESMMGEDFKALKTEDDTESQRLDADEETVTREFLQMLEDEEISGYYYKTSQPRVPPAKLEGQKNAADEESKAYLPDLGKGLGCVVQTRDGGYLASMNPLDDAVARKDTPKLAMQMSKPFVLPWNQSSSGFELFQKLASMELDELSSHVFTLMPIDELMGKTAEQTAFEGIASAIIQGRNKEGASSSAARIVSALKNMANAMSDGRKERISTGLWNVDENPLTAEQILAFSLQKIESMAVEALKIQTDMAEQEAPFDVSPLSTKTGGSSVEDLFASAVSLEEWINDQREVANIALIMVVQLRDPVRRYEAVGGPVIVLINATSADPEGNEYGDGEDKRFKVTSMHVGGVKLRSGRKKSGWDSEKQRLTGMQWLVAFGLGKVGKKGKHQLSKGQDLLWSISSRIVADMWLKPLRNPDVKLVK
ncbi:protein PLASTID MOVEMENT IMPAIRED 1 [Neltuma alba]|uniref:protein PLASTID MOVEMENT IMPAIRED 1 n=1 Tax=Neltuma alba TaxID=207710 RepID=UPI0010A4FC92|nr:protein PLASTID MOVEMENT IMPAIRED 1 [Prosopis alba]